jgi:hypothetical protein
MIENLTISSFRGIPGRLHIDFTDANGKAQSILLLGDNGTGKSSIADAIEFCLRGKVSRRGNAGAKTRYEARNLMTSRAPSVQVSLSGNHEFIRGASSRDYPGVHLGGGEIVPGFTLAPVVVSRADIEVFWKVNPTDRMRFFFDYLRDSAKHPGYAALEIERTEAKVQGARVGLLEAQIALAAMTGLPVAEIPIDDRGAFYEWRSHAYPQYGLSTARPYGARDPERSRALSQIPYKVRAAISRLQRQIEDIHKLRQNIAGLRSQLGLNGEVAPLIANELPALLDEISEQVSEDFMAVARLPHVRGVRISSTSNGYELRVICELSSGISVDPPQVLSEGALTIFNVGG